MSLIKNIANLTRHPTDGLLHVLPRENADHDLRSVSFMDQGGRWVVNGVSTAATMLVAAPVVGGIGLAARVWTADRSLPFKALVVPAVPLGIGAGLVSGLLNAGKGLGASLVGAAMVLGGAAVYPAQSVSHGLEAQADRQ